MFDAQKEIAKFRDAIARVEALPDDGFVLEVEGFYVNFNGGLFLGGLGFAAIYPLEAQARAVPEIKNGNGVVAKVRPIKDAKFFAVAGFESAIELLEKM